MGKICLFRFLYLGTLLSLACLACTPLLVPRAEKTSIPVSSPQFPSAIPTSERASFSPTSKNFPTPSPTFPPDLNDLYYDGPLIELKEPNRPEQIQIRNRTNNEISYPASLFEFSSSNPEEIAVNALGQVTALKESAQSRITVILKGQYWKYEHLLSVNQLDSDGSQYKTWRVNQDSDYQQSGPQIGIDADSDFLIVWSHFIPNPPPSLPDSHNQIMGQRYNAQGQPLSHAFKIGKTSFDFQGQDNPGLAMQKNGDFVVVWTFERKKIWGQAFYKNAQPKGPQFLISEKSHTYQNTIEGQKPSIAMAENGDFAVTWLGSFDQQNSASHVIFRRYSVSGHPKGEETIAPIQDGFHPQIAMDGQGNFVLLTQNLKALLFDKEGRTRGPAFQVNTSPFIQTYAAPEISMNTNGEWVVAWTSYLDTESRVHLRRSPALAKVFARKFNQAGEPMSPELGVSSSSYDDYVFSPNLGLTLNEGGEFSVLWFELNNLGNRFFIRSYSRDNLPFKLEVNFQFKWGNSNPHPRLKLSKQADAIMVWQSGDISLDIFARRVKLNR